MFRGTRVPVSALCQNLENGAQLAKFVDWLPRVELYQDRTVLIHRLNGHRVSPG